jgi:Flp pilus assembly pilin Flp
MIRKIGALMAVLVLGLTALAVAQGDGARTDAAQATFSLTKGATQERTCTGTDGTYRDARETFTGTVTSSDPRLAGTIELRTSSFINQDKGLGTTSGKVTLRDAQTGALKAKGALVAVNTERGVLNGFLSARLKAGGGTLSANVTATFNADGTQVTGELGGGAAQNTAVVQDGHCSGRIARTKSKGDDHGRHAHGSDDRQADDHGHHHGGGRDDR